MIEVVINRHFRKEFAASVAVVVRPSPHFLSPPQHALPMNSAGITAMFFSFSGGRVFLAILPQMQSDGTVLISELSNIERGPVGFTISTFCWKVETSASGQNRCAPKNTNMNTFLCPGSAVPSSSGSQLFP